jgi:hypothetical protein
MENLLLVLDEIDDLFSTLGLVWRPVVSFLSAVAMFVVTGFIFLTIPMAAEILAIALVSLGLLDMLRQRRNQQAAVETAQDL